MRVINKDSYTQTDRRDGRVITDQLFSLGFRKTNKRKYSLILLIHDDLQTNLSDLVNIQRNVM